MNNKHLACLILSVFVIVFVQAGLMMNRKMSEAKSNLEQAQNSLQMAENTLSAKRVGLQTLRQDTGPIRAYLSKWKEDLEDTNEETKARALFQRVLKQTGEGLVTFSNRSGVEAIKDGVYVPHKFRSSFSVEGDYANIMALIGNLERQLPSCRISNLTISKGQRGNDVKLALSLEIPMIKSKEDKQ